jgi:hypothetical protein
MFLCKYKTFKAELGCDLDIRFSINVNVTVKTGMMTSTMPVAAILGAADVNDAHDYYHYSDEPNYVYCGNHSHCYRAHL